MSGSGSAITRRHLLVWGGAAAAMRLLPAEAASGAAVTPQVFFAAVGRALQALEQLGEPVSAQDAVQLASLAAQNDVAAVQAAEKVLNRYTLAHLEIEENGFARSSAGDAPRTLVEQGWRLFLVRVSNTRGSTNRLTVRNLDTAWQSERQVATFASRPGLSDTPGDYTPYVAQNWMVPQLYDGPPLPANLSGSPVEYKVLQVFSRDRGTRSAHLSFADTNDKAILGQWVFRNRSTGLQFQCLPSNDVSLTIRDTDGRGCVASLIIRDGHNRIYPLQAMRIAPDMPFQRHVYRGDGETVRLPAGQYTVESGRGPEYLRTTQSVAISDTGGHIEVRLQRWIDPSKWNWYSGDPHIHAAGCSHYERPTEGVTPQTMIRHVRGEALSIGGVLTWGPSWYYQKQFFSGHASSPEAGLEHPQLQTANNASLQPRATPEDGDSWLRYDVEVSGFPSSHCGHLALLRLKEQDYPGTQLIQDWPSWNLPILRWAKAQGAVVGYTHCGFGLAVDSTELPNYEIPPMDGPGAIEAVVDVTFGQVDFLGGCNTIPLAELNLWYHLLNCGFRLALTGETDYPCISGEAPGVGRTYVRLDQRPADDAGYDAWVRGIQQGRVYSGDGRAHILDFRVSGRRSGDEDVQLSSAGTVQIEALVAARLEPEPPANRGRKADLDGWHVENARIDNSRTVAVELIVNGHAVGRTTLTADGTPQPLKFRTRVTRSSWIALRIFPTVHSHPVFVQVNKKPIRASKRSAQWCMSWIDRVWEVKSPFIRASEAAEAKAAFAQARAVYESIAAESP